MGIVLYAFGLGEKLENTFANRLPYYNNFIDHRIEIWSQPEKGLLAGKVSEIIDSENLKIKDLARQEWLVDISNVHDDNRNIIKKNTIIKVIGEKEAEKEHSFKAIEIRPWQGRHEECHHHMRRARLERIDNYGGGHNEKE